jgi:hypothetical protein
VGQFSIAWDFNIMSFQQVDPPITSTAKIDEAKELQWV